jgi:hypothetical protein
VRPNEYYDIALARLPADFVTEAAVSQALRELREWAERHAVVHEVEVVVETPTGWARVNHKQVEGDD